MNTIYKNVQNALVNCGFNQEQRKKNVTVLLSMIIAHESGQLQYCRQIGGIDNAQNKAVGLYQMEKATMIDVARYGLTRNDLCPYIKNKMDRILDGSIDFYDLIFDFDLSTMLARVFFLRIPEFIPPFTELEKISDYAKKYWNTSEGKATPEKYLEDYKKIDQVCEQKGQ